VSVGLKCTEELPRCSSVTPYSRRGGTVPVYRPGSPVGGGLGELAGQLCHNKLNLSRHLKYW